ncbi:MAG: GC-type dockerin domain-anchored protein [Phycisphaerales bacterium]
MIRTVLCAGAMAVAAGLAASAFADPVLVLTSLSSDMTSNGNKCVGLVYDNSIQKYVPYVWERGVGYTRIDGVYPGQSEPHCSDDASALGMGAPNSTNWGNLNCFGGYCFNGYADVNHTIPCTLGDPLPPPNPCGQPDITHRWTAATGWVGGGSFTRTLDAATGRYYGGTRCDYTINSTHDISGNGRYTIGGAYYAQLTTTSGTPGFGVCGNYWGFRYDSQTGLFEKLQTSANNTRADHVNFDGSVITGWSEGPVANGNTNGRRICAWVNGVEVILDAMTDQSATYPVNGPGTVIAGTPGNEFLQTNFGQSGTRLVRWVRQPNDSWTPQNLGRPVDRFDPIVVINPLSALYVNAISDDGNTIVGTGLYGGVGPGAESRPFIWRPTLNGGVPLDLADYLQSISPSSPILQEGLAILGVRGLSADGNTLLVTLFDNRNTCTEPSFSHTGFYSGILYLNGAGIACEPVRIGLGPKDTSSTQYTPFGVSLNVAASGTWPMTFQWQREDPQNPGTWTDLTESCMNFDRTVDWDFEGVHKNQLRIGELNCGNGRSGRYRVVVTNGCGSVTSDPATVSFPGWVNFNAQPANASVCVNGSTSFTTTVWGANAYNFQWEINDPANPGQWLPVFDGGTPDGFLFTTSTNTTGPFTATLNVAPTGRFTSANNRTFRCMINNACGDTPSNTATLTIACPNYADVAHLGGEAGCDGMLTVDDIVSFLAQFFGGNLAVADLVSLGGGEGPDGQITVDDLVAFLSAFFAGCQ